VQELAANALPLRLGGYSNHQKLSLASDHAAQRETTPGIRHCETSWLSSQTRDFFC
jgi:hypothetical protein